MGRSIRCQESIKLQSSILAS